MADLPAPSASTRPVVLITGCSSGIGRAAARCFAERGWAVYASMRSVPPGEPLLAEAAERGWALQVCQLDVTRQDSIDAALAHILDEQDGRLDAVINNAGYFCRGPIEETTPEELQAQLDTNVLGVLRVCRAVLPGMRARGAGAIVNVSSTNGRTAMPVAGPYQISKFGVEALTETLRYEVAPFGVRVVCVEPGSFATDFHRKEKLVAAAGRPDSPYAPLLAAYRRRLEILPRAPVDEVVEALYRACTESSPPLRIRVGPFSFLACVARYFTPDRLYEGLVGLVFGWRKGR